MMHGGGYTALPKVGQKPARPTHLTCGISMRRMPIVLIAIILVLIGAIVLLSSLAREVPTRTIETEVPAGGNAQ